MNQTKTWTVATLTWLCTFFTIERLHEPMNIASFVYVLVAALAVGVVLLPRIRVIEQIGLIVGSLSILLIGKTLLGYAVWGAALPITVTEAAAISLTIYLVGQVQRSLRELGESAMRVALAEPLTKAGDFEHGQVQIYRDLRLARRHKRSMSLFTLTPRMDDSTDVPDRLIQEMVRKSASQYLRGQIAHTLVEVTGGCATVLGRDDHLVVAMPELDKHQGRELLNEVREQIREKLGVEIDAGMASFPDHEITLRGLLDRAEATMRMGGRPCVVSHSPDSFPVLAGNAGS